VASKYFNFGVHRIRDVHPDQLDPENHPIPPNLSTCTSYLFRSGDLHLCVADNKPTELSAFSISFWFFIPDKDDQFRIRIGPKESDMSILFWGRLQKQTSHFTCIFSHELYCKQATQEKTWCHITINLRQYQDGNPPICSFWFNGENYQASVPNYLIKLDSIFLQNFTHFTTSYHSKDSYNACRFTDLRVSLFCLTPPEVKAIYEQKTSSDKVNMDIYFNKE
jgi:hypothetical protein